MGEEVVRGVRGEGREGGDPARAVATMVDEGRRQSLLRRITEEGGFAYVRSAEKAAGGDLRAAEASREMAWEQLHSGPWHEVGAAWRDAYALACLNVAELRAGAGELGEALRALDMGVIMGGPLLRSDLDAAIDRIVARKRAHEEDDDCSCVEEGAVGEEFARKWTEGHGQNRDLAEVFHLLPIRSLSSKKVQKQESLSLEAFISDYFSRDSPVIISGCIDHWPARTKWKDLEYLQRIAGDRTVPDEFFDDHEDHQQSRNEELGPLNLNAFDLIILSQGLNLSSLFDRRQVGRSYLCSERKQELITFSQLLKRIHSINCSASLIYLAQHPLFDQIRELRDDIMIPDYCFAGGGELQTLNAWFGPVGTVTPLHNDPHHNIFAQVVGKKYIRLYPDLVSESLYPRNEAMLYNSSQVDLDNIDSKEFPKFEELDFIDCVLEEGGMLYIPPKWWHCMRSLSTSFSVSFWWKAITL